MRASLFSIALALLTLPAWAEDAADALFATARPALAHVTAPSEHTGFFIDDQGTLLTVLDAAPPATIPVDAGGQSWPARLIGFDAHTGVAALQVPGAHPFLPLSAQDTAALRTPVTGIGYPAHQPPALQSGMIDALECRHEGRFFCTTYLRANLSVDPCQLGGPVLDGNGALLGMMVFPQPPHETYVVPAAALRKIVDDLRAHGRVVRGWVGVGVDPNGPGVRINQLFPGTPAAASGLQPGDRVVQIDGRPMRQPSDVIDASFFSQVGGKMTVLVDRQGAPQTFTFTVGERPDRLPGK